MKPKALMLSAAVLLSSVAVAFAQTQTPTSSSSSMPGGTGSSAVQSNKAQPGSTGMTQAQTQPPRTSKHRAMASRGVRSEPTADERSTTALNILEDHGYRDFSTFHPMGRDFAITVNQNGRTVTVVVDPDANTLRTEG